MTKISFSDIAELTITRAKSGRGWKYTNGDAELIRDRDEIDRLNAIALPPAYQDARFNPNPNGHILAIGVDARGRRQYRYHLDFRARQDSAKFDGCAGFGKALPKLRKQVEVDLAGKPLEQDTVIAAVIRVLDATHARVGNEAYAKENKSFGITTLRNRHATVTNSAMTLEYRGKSGIMKNVRLDDRSLLRVVRKVQDLRGQHLFQYKTEDGGIRPVTSSEVNDYIRAAMDEDFTAKHFRTWGASVAALAAVRGGAGLKEMLAEVAEALGNTPAIARKSYIHPAIVEDAKESRVPEVPKQRALQYFSADERALLDYLEAAAS